jgi:hypothetical protein
MIIDYLLYNSLFKIEFNLVILLQQNSTKHFCFY